MAEKVNPWHAESSDQELVAAVNRGEWAAFDILYARYRDWVRILAGRFTGEENDAQDVVQEVFTYLAGKFRTGLELRVEMRSLLYPAVKHTALTIRRKRRREMELSEAIENNSPAREVQSNSTKSDIAEVLRGLSEAHREVILMRFVDDMTLEEIGATLGIPTGTVKSRLHHALAGLREDPRLRKYFERG